MEKNSTPNPCEGSCRSNSVTISYFDESLFEPVAFAPRLSTIERIRQFARAVCVDPAFPEMAIVLN